MIKGMTGYGSVHFSANEVKGIIEIKSQNHRYFDPVFYLPLGFSAVEGDIKDMLAKEVKRGRVTVSVKITEKENKNVQFNKSIVREYLTQSKKLTKEFSLDNNLTLADLVRLPGVIETNDVFSPVEELWPSVERGLKQAMRSLVMMRAREGKSLSVNIRDILRKMTQQIKAIENQKKLLLRNKQRELGPEEFSVYQKSSDVNEEITRLKHYIEEFANLLKSEGQVGKKMDFVAQEMQRETNTIGSKVQDRIISNAVISIKSKIEKLREQAQNLE